MIEPGNVRTDFTASRRDVQPPPGLGDGDSGDNGGGDPYAAMVAKAVGLMARDEANGVAADDVAAAIAAILRSPHPRRRVSVGKAGERVGVIAKRLMPYRLFERAAKSSLGV